jgi:3-hydroxyacyl-CoA dehydrogenase/enoyl-CoA hydratase/3-hydroxybutyryl-CoA epimerase
MEPVIIDKALEIEARYFVDTLFSKETKNIIRASFIFINDAARGKSKPKGYDRVSSKVGVIGAGMMGAGIAYVMQKGRNRCGAERCGSSKSRKWKRLYKDTRAEKIKTDITEAKMKHAKIKTSIQMLI